MRTGEDYVSALSDGRAVYIDGERVADVSGHPAFRGVIDSVARLYDFAGKPENDMLFTSPDNGQQLFKGGMIPRSRADFASRREALRKWAALSGGWLGRGPDVVSSFFAGFASKPEVFDRGERKLSGNFLRWYQKVLTENPFMTYVLTPSNVGRMANPADGETVQVTVVKKDDAGIVVRGSQMLGTSSAISDYIFVSRIEPLAPEQTAQAVSFVVPANARGLKLYCRRSYASGQPGVFDYPLSTRFDESDAIVIFDDVFVPWEDIFVCGDVAATRAQFFETAGHALGNHQAQIRLVEKLNFIVGVTRKISRINQTDRHQPVMEKLGEMSAIAAMVEACLVASEANAVTDPEGVVRPNPRFLYSAMGLQAELYPKVLHIARELVGGGVIQLPSSRRELADKEIYEDFDHHFSTPGVPAHDRVKLHKLAWDMIGSEFAGRHHQYEMFYAGPPSLAKSNAFRHYGYDEQLHFVDEFLDGYDLRSEA